MTPYQAVGTNEDSGSSYVTTKKVAVKFIIAPP